MIYFTTGDEVYLGMYAISCDEWEHDSGNESDSSLPLFWCSVVISLVETDFGSPHVF